MELLISAVGLFTSLEAVMLPYMLSSFASDTDSVMKVTGSVVITKFYEKQKNY